jgi:acyl-CoA thioester hydrolase
MTSLPEPSAGRLDGAIHSYLVRAYFEDTDLSGMVYHANYLRWFERARTELLRLLGIEQRSAVDSGEGFYTVTEIQVRYYLPARLDDMVTIQTVAEELRGATCRLSQRALRGETLLCEARLRIGFVGPDGRARRQPAAWREAFSKLQQHIPEPA